MRKPRQNLRRASGKLGWFQEDFAQMDSPALSYFGHLIEECRAGFDTGALGLLRWIGLRVRPSYDSADQIFEGLKPHYKILMKHGTVVWGCVSQVNMGIFAPGQLDLPGVTVYSTDPYFDAHPQDLFAIGRACFQFKNTDPVDPDFKPVAVRLTDEYDMTVRMRLPRQLTDGREVFLAATMFHRSRLPGGVLRGSLFPVVIAPEATEANMVLQLPYWSPALTEAWTTIQFLLEEITSASTAQQVAANAEKRPASSRPADWDVSKTPIFVTPAMVAKFHSIVAAMNFTTQPYLYVGLTDDGMPFADLVSDFDARLECVHESNGIYVIFNKKQRERLRGTMVDHKESLFSAGILIRLPGE